MEDLLLPVVSGTGPFVFTATTSLEYSMTISCIIPWGDCLDLFAYHTMQCNVYEHAATDVATGTFVYQTSPVWMVRDVQHMAYKRADYSFNLLSRTVAHRIHCGNVWK